MKPGANLVRWAGVALVVLVVGCADPYKQTIEPVGSRDYDSFVGAVKKLPIEEKNLVNDYVARKREDGVQPVGITLREAIDEQRRHEAEMASLPNKLIDGAVKVARALGPKPAVVVPPVAPTIVVTPTAPTPVAPAVTVLPVLPTAPVTASPVAPTVAPQPVVPPVAPGGAAGALPATGLEMSALLQEVDAERFPDSRVALIKRRASSMRFTTRQAVALAQTVPFAGMRVELLAALYPRVVDPQSFDEAYRVLEFAEDRDALKSRIDAMSGR